MKAKIDTLAGIKASAKQTNSILRRTRCSVHLDRKRNQTRAQGKQAIRREVAY